MTFVNPKYINLLFKNIIEILSTKNWLLLISILITIPAIITYILGLINDKINKSYILEKSLSSKIFKIIWLPFLFFLWFESIFIALRIGFPEMPFMQINNIDNIPFVILLFSISWLIFRILSSLENIFFYRNNNNGFKEPKIPFQLFFKLIKICLVIATSLFILQNMGVDILTLILFSGSYLSVIGGLIVANSILRIIHHKLISVVIKNSHFWIYILIKSLYLPLQALLIIGSTYICYKIAIIKWPAPEAVSEIVTKAYSLSLLGLLAWFFIRFAKMFEDQLLLGRLTKKQPGKTTVQATGKLLKVIMLVILVLVSLPIIGIPISGILAFSGGSAIVVGIALKPILANYFGGVMIYSDRFFEVGDWVHSPDKDIEGTVEDIGWRSTRIRTFDKRPLYVPNSFFSEICVINASRMSNRRIKETFGIRYQDSSTLDTITRDIRAMLKEHAEIDTKQTLLVHFTEFGPSSLNINVYTFTKTRDWRKYRDIQQDVFLNIIKIIEENGAKLAVPERSLNVKAKPFKEEENNIIL